MQGGGRMGHGKHRQVRRSAHCAKTAASWGGEPFWARASKSRHRGKAVERPMRLTLGELSDVELVGLPPWRWKLRGLLFSVSGWLTRWWWRLTKRRRLKRQGRRLELLLPRERRAR